MPPEAGRIGFLPVTSEHFGLLEAWLAAPHILEWWGDSDEELRFIRDMVEGRDTTLPFLIMLDGAPVGYIQMWHVGDHQEDSWLKDNPWLGELAAETVGVDLFIGEAGLLSCGIGSAALVLFVNRLRAEGRSDIIIDPDTVNLRAVRAYEKAGFRPIEKLLGKTGDALIMRHDPARTTT